jgi:hypothetical protein
VEVWVKAQRVATIALGAATAVGLLAGCGTAPPVDATGVSTTSETETSHHPDSDPSASDLPTAGTSSDAEPSGAWDLVLTDVRVAEHESFDRIVLEFKGTGTPGWSVHYVDEAVLEGSGERVPLDGDAVLDLSASGTVWPAPGYYDGPRRLEPATGVVDDVYVAGTFEGYTQVLVGIGGHRVPFRTFTLAGPPRLVVDVVDDGTD